MHRKTRGQEGQTWPSGHLDDPRPVLDSHIDYVSFLLGSFSHFVLMELGTWTGLPAKGTWEVSVLGQLIERRGNRERNSVKLHSKDSTRCCFCCCLLFFRTESYHNFSGTGVFYSHQNFEGSSRGVVAGTVGERRTGVYLHFGCPKVDHGPPTTPFPLESQPEGSCEEGPLPPWHRMSRESRIVVLVK